MIQWTDVEIYVAFPRKTGRNSTPSREDTRTEQRNCPVPLKSSMVNQWVDHSYLMEYGFRGCLQEQGLKLPPPLGWWFTGQRVSSPWEFLLFLWPWGAVCFRTILSLLSFLWLPSLKNSTSRLECLNQEKIVGDSTQDTAYTCFSSVSDI